MNISHKTLYSTNLACAVVEAMKQMLKIVGYKKVKNHVQHHNSQDYKSYKPETLYTHRAKALQDGFVLTCSGERCVMLHLAVLVFSIAKISDEISKLVLNSRFCLQKLHFKSGRLLLDLLKYTSFVSIWAQIQAFHDIFWIAVHESL